MSDNFGRIVAGVFGVLLLFYLPLLVSAKQQEQSAQAYVDNAVVEFVDNARATGSITDASYEALCNKIDTMGILCHVRMEHIATQYAKDEIGNVEDFYYTYNKNDILDTIYTDMGENKKYYLNDGDFLKVTVYNTAPSWATKLQRFIMPLYAPNNTTIQSVYSGYVGNDAQ